jgi:hypothetical protein
MVNCLKCSFKPDIGYWWIKYYTKYFKNQPLQKVQPKIEISPYPNKIP